jgi:hypothetical protein
MTTGRPVSHCLPPCPGQKTPCMRRPAGIKLKKGHPRNNWCPSPTPTGLAVGLGPKKLALRQPSSTRPRIGSPVACALGGQSIELSHDPIALIVPHSAQVVNLTTPAPARCPIGPLLLYLTVIWKNEHNFKYRPMDYQMIQRQKMDRAKASSPRASWTILWPPRGRYPASKW